MSTVVLSAMALVIGWLLPSPDWARRRPRFRRLERPIVDRSRDGQAVRTYRSVDEVIS